MKSYVFSVVLERDEQAWRAYISGLKGRGAASWGKKKGEALGSIREVAQMVIRSMLEDGEPLPSTRSKFTIALSLRRRFRP